MSTLSCASLRCWDERCFFSFHYFQFPKKKKKKKSGYFYLNKIKKDKIQLLFFVNCKSLPTGAKAGHTAAALTAASGSPDATALAFPAGRSAPARSVPGGRERGGRGGLEAVPASPRFPRDPLRPLRPTRRAPGSPAPPRRGTSCLQLPRRPPAPAPAPAACRPPPGAAPAGAPRRCPRPGRVAAPPAAPRAALSRAGRAGKAARCPPPRARAPAPGWRRGTEPQGGGAPGWAPSGGSVPGEVTDHPGGRGEPGPAQGRDRAALQHPTVHVEHHPEEQARHPEASGASTV